MDQTWRDEIAKLSDARRDAGERISLEAAVSFSNKVLDAIGHCDDADAKTLMSTFRDIYDPLQSQESVCTVLDAMEYATKIRVYLEELARLRIEAPDPAPVWPDTQAVADWALMNSRGERILSPE